MQIAFRVSAFAVAAMGTAALAQPPMSAADKLKACEARYAEMKTYEDSGEVKIEFKTSRPFSDTRPFKTAFQRGGGFHWQFESSAMPGRKPRDIRYAVWSADQKSFQSWWTIGEGVEKHETIGGAMAGPTGVSGGSATAIVPLLLPDIELNGRTTRLEDAVEKAGEKVDGVQCSVISGTDGMGSAVTVWLDPELVIRQIVSVQEIDPKEVDGGPSVRNRSVEKFTTITTITIKPVVNEEIPAERFVEKAGAKAEQAK